ncbi:GNAT family N-acetyltransferase [Methanoculleus caldifontis]|uniref:GNAT family N-acetyltransferase n=1 Tax=Methanoculleus caldifontis TaxID=2651577 RepID=UPI002936E360|nr:GNAT family N-acetyltransferase [Methanoculleus sp. Wushi-C6]
MSASIITDREVWDAFIDESPSGLLFHRWDFLKITERHTGYRFLPYGIYKGEELLAVCPLFCRQTNGISIVLSPPPMQAVIPYQGVVMGREYAAAKQSKKESILQVIADGLGEAVGTLAPNYLSITFVPGFHDVRRFIWDGYQTRISYSYTIDLAPSLETLWGNLNAKLRTSLRRFEKEGYYLEEGSDLSLFYDTVRQRFGRPEMNIPMITLDYFEDVFRAYPEYVHVYHLYDRDGDLKGVGTTQEYKRYILWVGGPKIEGTSANEYLQWSLLRDAKLKGFPEFENTGANNPNLNMHKAKYNPDLSIFFEVSREDGVGRVAKWAYSNIINRPQIKKRMVPYVR